MTDTLRIKRRLLAGGPGVPVSLANAELAYNEASHTLYYGEGTGGSGGSATTVVPIGGTGAFATNTYVDARVATIATIAALRTATTATLPVSDVQVRSYAGTGVKGGGRFLYVSTDTTSTDNGGTIIVDASARRWYRDAWQNDRVSVTWFGAVADGVTNCTPAFQAVVNLLLANQGGELYVPAGSYALATPVIITITNSTYTGPRIRLHGDGGQASFLICAGSGIQYAGAAGNQHTSQFDINGINIEGPLTAGSIGLSINNGSYVTTSDFVVSSFDTGVSCIDVEISEFGPGTRLRWNNKGLTATASSVTGFNSIAFRGATVASNYVYGAYCKTGVNLLLDNADIQYNGASTQANTSWGLRLDDYGLTNGVGLVAINAYFEGNGGCADIWLNNSASGPTSINTLTGTLFAKTDATKYVKNPILVSGTQATEVFLIGCSFTSVSPYVPSAANLYWVVTNTGLATNRGLPSNVYSIGDSCLLQSPTETPPSVFTSPYLSAGTLGVGTSPNAGESAVFRPKFNEVLGIAGDFAVAGSITVTAHNDTNNAVIPLELRASNYYLTTGPVYMNPSLSVGAGVANLPGEMVVVRPKADEIFSVSSDFAVTGSVALAARNDGNTALVPMEYRASAHHFSSGSVWKYAPFYTAAVAAPATPPAGWFVTYVDAADGKLKVKGPGGTITILANA